MAKAANFLDWYLPSLQTSRWYIIVHKYLYFFFPQTMVSYVFFLWLNFPPQLVSIVFIGNARLTQAKMTLFTVWVRVNDFLLTPPSLSVLSSVCVASFTRWLVCYLPHQHPSIVSKQTKLYIFLFFSNYKWYFFPFHTFPRFNFSDSSTYSHHKSTSEIWNTCILFQGYQ